MELKLFDKPDYAAGRPGDAAWYKEREVSDHIHQEGMHRGRLLEAADLVEYVLDAVPGKIPMVADWGAGNGGLLNELTVRRASRGAPLNAFGYDLSPLAVEDGIKRYGVKLMLFDAVKSHGLSGDITILTEFLEHLVSPHDLIKKVEGAYIVASSPANENHLSHYEYHLWAWTGDSFAQMFERTGWRVLRHFCRADVNTQFILAERR